MTSVSRDDPRSAVARRCCRLVLRCRSLPARPDAAIPTQDEAVCPRGLDRRVRPDGSREPHPVSDGVAKVVGVSDDRKIIL